MNNELKRLQIEKATIADDEQNEIIKTMTPKEKAKELYHKFQVYEVNGQKRVKYGPEIKVFALIAVDECLVAVESDWGFMQRRIEFWQEVKKEIEKL